MMELLEKIEDVNLVALKQEENQKSSIIVLKKTVIERLIKKAIDANHVLQKKRYKNNPKNCHFYIDGRSKKQHYCIESDCNEKVGGPNRRCKSCAAKGELNSMYGKERLDNRMRIGKKGFNYIDGRTPLHFLIRNLEYNKKWRKAVFKRDNYTCEDCNVRGGNLEAHHKKRFSVLLTEFLQHYNQFSPLEDKETLTRLAMKHKPFWNIKNGKTLCKDCHNKTKGRPKMQIYTEEKI